MGFMVKRLGVILGIILVGVVITIAIIHYHTGHHRTGYTSTPVMVKTNNTSPPTHSVPKTNSSTTVSKKVNEKNTTVTTSTTTTSSVQKQSPIPGIHFYVFGLSTCPHCRHLEYMLDEVFGGKSLTFYNLATPSGQEKYGKAFGLLTKYTFSDGVPQVGVFVNGTLKAVILGDFTEESNFVQKLKYYISTVTKLSEENNVQYVLIDSASGPYYVNQTSEVKTLTDIFINPEKFK